MGNLASKVKGDSPRLSRHQWPSSAPSGSWVIRFSSEQCRRQKMMEIKGLPLYQWFSPDLITGDSFNKLMFVVVQIFLEGNHNRLRKLIEEPLEAVEMIDQFNTFINSTNQDMNELQNQLFDAAYESINLHVEDEQLHYLDVLVTGDFDPKHEVRAVLSRKNRSSKSSLLRSVTSTIKSKLGCFKKKGRQASCSNPAQKPFSVPSHDSSVVYTPLRPTAPRLFELNERTETVTTNDRVENTDELCLIDLSDNSIINSTKDGDREGVGKESDNPKKVRNLEEKNTDFSSLSSSSTSETVIVSPSTSAQFLVIDEGGCCSKVSQEPSNDTDVSFTAVKENAIILQSKGNSDKEKNIASGSCVQENANENTDSHSQVSDSIALGLHSTWDAETEEQHSSNSGPVCSNVPSESIRAHEHSKDINGPFCTDVPSGLKQADSLEHSNDNGQSCGNVPSGSKQAESNEHSTNNGLVCTDVSSGSKQAESNGHTKDNGPTSSDVPSVSKQAESYGHFKSNDALCTDIHSGSKEAEPNGHNKVNGPTSSDVPPVSKQAESNGHSKDNGPTSSDVPSVSQQAESNGHIKHNGPICTDAPSGSKQFDGPVYADSPPTTSHAESTEENDYNGPQCNDVPQGTCTVLVDSSQHHNNDDPVNTQFMVSPEKHPSNSCTFLPIYGLSKSCLTSTTQPVSTDEQGICANVKEEKQDHSAKPQMSKPSSSSFVCLPFHGLSRSCFSPPQQGDSTGVLSRKRKADMNQADGFELSAKRLKQNDTFCEAGENSDSCHSNAEGAGKVVPLSTSEQSCNELITKQKEVSCSKVSQSPSSDKYISFTSFTDNAIIFQPKEIYDKEKDAVSGSCLQEDVSENTDVHSQVSDGIVHAHPCTWDVEVGEQHSSNSDPGYSNVPSVSVQAESNEHSKDNGLTCGDFFSGSKDPAHTMASAKLNPSNPCTFLPIYGLSKSCLTSTTQPVSTDEQGICANVKEEKQDHSAKPQMSKPSSSSFVCLPFHGLSRGCFSPPQQGESTGVQSRKRKANMDQADEVELSAKRLKQNDTFCEAGENSDSCHSNAEGAGSKSDTEMKPRCNINDDDTESDGGNDSSSSESIEWHDALEDV